MRIKLGAWGGRFEKVDQVRRGERNENEERNKERGDI